MPLTYDGATLAIQHVMGHTIWTMPRVYLGASTTQPSPLKTGFSELWNFTEPVGMSYARIDISGVAPPGTHKFGPAANGTMYNSVAAAEFPQASGTWGLMGWIGYCTSASGFAGANILIGFKGMDQQISISSGGTLSFPIGSLTSVSG